MYLSLYALARRFESAGDVVLFIVFCIYLLGGDYLLRRFFPSMSRRIRRLILVVAVIVIAVILGMIAGALRIGSDISTAALYGVRV